MTSRLRQQKNLERKLRTRTALLAAAAKVFTRHGYHQTLISEIVAEANVGQGTFYRSFNSKRDIVVAIFDELVEQLLEKFSGMSASLPVSLEEYRSASIKAVLQLATTLDEHREIMRMLLREAPSIDAEFERKLTSIFGVFAQLAQSYLDHAIARGFARQCRSAVIAQSLVGIAQRLMTTYWEGQFAETTLETLITEVVDFAFMGFGLESGALVAGSARRPGLPDKLSVESPS